MSNEQISDKQLVAACDLYCVFYGLSREQLITQFKELSEQSVDDRFNNVIEEAV